MMASIIPLNAALATNESPGTDGLVVVVKPRNAVAGDDGAMIMGAIDGLYIFDVTLYDANGGPFMVTDYSVDINSLYGEDQGYAPLMNVWSDRWTVPATNQMTVRVPVLDLMWADTPFGGAGFTVVAHRDGNGVSLKPAEGPMPAGSYNLLANEAVKNGRFRDADQLDEIPTPIGFTSGQVDGLVELGNPLLNPGFEVGFFDPRGDTASEPRLYAPGYQNYATSTFPWYAVLNNPDGQEGPASKHYFTGGSAVGGSHLAVRYDVADDGKGLGVGQLLLPGYVATSDLALTFDVQVYDFASKMSNAALSVNMHGNDETGVDHLDSGNIELPVDGQWHRVTVPMVQHNVWSNRYDLTGMDLTSVYFDFSHGTSDGLWGTPRPDATPIFKFDNVVIEGITYKGGASPRNDLNDGYSTFIEPLASTLSEGQDVVIDLVNLADGSAAYVFELAAMDYLGGQAETVNLDGQSVVFQLLDQNFIMTAGSHASNDVTYATTTMYSYLGPEGTTSERVLALVQNEDLIGFQVPWMFTDLEPSSSAYADTFGQAANPASGYYSPARNALKPFSLADQLDYMATPVFLSGVASINGVSPTTITLACPTAVQGDSCAADPTPELEVVVETTSQVIETLTVSIVSAANTSKVLGTQTITTPTGAVSFQLTQSQVDDLRDVEGDMTVLATVGGGLFAANAESISLDLDNVLPVAGYALGPQSTFTKFTNFVLTDASTDTDGTIVARQWNVTFVNDDTPDADATPAGWYKAGTGATFPFTVEDDGNYHVKLTVTDNKNGAAIIEGDFTVNNVKPSGAISGPAATAFATVPFTATSSDDGIVIQREWTATNATGDVVLTAVDPIGGVFAVPFAVDGVYNVTLVLTDDDLETTSIVKSIVVDGVKPVTVLTIPAAPASGWFTDDVTIGVSRSDVGTGIATTAVAVGTTVVNTAGSGNFTHTVTDDGVHTVSAFSTDKVGNVGATVSGLVKVDKTAPTVAIVSLGILPGMPGIARAGDNVTITATAADAASGVSKVQFFVNSNLVYVDTDGSDGYNFDLDTTGMGSDLHEITVLAWDVAGHVSVSDSENLLVVG